jgi:drug/metabolite transporter (DMT)-like permease
VLFYTYPAMVAVLEALMGERLSPLAWGALATTLLGIAFTAPDFSAGLSGGNLPGVLLALADGFMVAIYFLISSRIMHPHHDMITTSAYTVTGGFAVMLVAGALLGVGLPQGDSWLLLAALALVCTVLPVFGLNAGIRALGSTRSAIIATFEPVLTALLALVFLGELLQPLQWLGGLIIIASVIVLQIRRPPAADAEQAALARE